MSRSFIFSSESVTEGHPDKVCDTVSDAVLDACLEQDSGSRVACETFVKDNVVGLAGEITTSAVFDYGQVVGDTLRGIGYDADYAEGTEYSYSCKFEKGAFLINMLGNSPKILSRVSMRRELMGRKPMNREQVTRESCLDMRPMTLPS